MLEFPNKVIFDLDNTLYEFKRPNEAGEKALFKFISDHLMLPMKEVSSMYAGSKLSVKNRLGKVAASHSRLLYIREFLTQNKFSIHATFAVECEQVYWRTFLENSELFEGVEEFISYLRLRKVMLILLTDLTSHIQLRKLAWFGLDRSFDLIMTSEEAGGDKETGKPASELSKHISLKNNVVWCIGDMDWDHLFPSESIFLKKVENGNLKKIGPETYKFGNFHDLLSNIDPTARPV